MSDLYLYNTLTRTRDIFKPIDPSHVRLYVCGPTVYAPPHIGNARPYTVFDVLFRLLQRLYPRVTYARNITDVDDKIIAAAKERHVSIDVVTREATEVFHGDMKALGNLKPTLEPRATDHIQDMIQMIQTLIDQGHAYLAGGHVLFDTASYQPYGELSNRTLDQMQAGARIQVEDYKKSPYDFVLWKPAAVDDVGWQSPWGYGRPGWHIECSAKSKACLGDMFDIHGGGIDLIFPHHENERAQSCAANGTSHQATYWMHNGHVIADGQKMSKSLGNFFYVGDKLKKFPGEAIRYTLLATHYRQPLDFRDELAMGSKQILDRLYGALVGSPAAGEPHPEVLQALMDDLNTPKALQVLQTLAAQIYKADGAQKTKLQAELKASANLMGFLELSPDTWFQGEKKGRLDPDTIQDLIQKRLKAKEVKDFVLADSIRDALLSQGVVLEDGPKGTTWKWK